MAFTFEKIFKGTEDFPVGVFDHNAYIPQVHNHLENEMFYISEGTAFVTIENVDYQGKKGDFFFIKTGSNHCVRELSEDFHYYAIVFDDSIIGSESESTIQTLHRIIVNPKLELTDEIFNTIKTTTEFYQKDEFGKEIATKNMIFQILLHIIRTKQYAPLPSLQDARSDIKSIDNGLNFIRTHYRENISLEDLLESTNYSKSHFIRMFKNKTGMNYTDYLNRYRVEKACHDLVFSPKNVTQIAIENGFNNIQYFSKIFKKYMECTPKQYQTKWHIAKKL